MTSLLRPSGEAKHSNSSCRRYPKNTEEFPGLAVCLPTVKVAHVPNPCEASHVSQMLFAHQIEPMQKFTLPQRDNLLLEPSTRKRCTTTPYFGAAHPSECDACVLRRDGHLTEVLMGAGCRDARTSSRSRSGSHLGTS